MKFYQTLLELQLTTDTRTKDLKKWLTVQKSLYQRMMDKKEVDPRDMEQFAEFGKYFYNHVKQYKKTPTLKQVERALRV